MVRDALMFEQSSERNHAEIGDRVFWVETMANVKTLGLVRIWYV